MTTPDETRTFQERLQTDDALRRRAESIRCDAFQRNGRWYAGPAHVRMSAEADQEACFEPPYEPFDTREEAETYARAYALHRLQDTAE